MRRLPGECCTDTAVLLINKQHLMVVFFAADFLGEEVVHRHMNGAGRAGLLRRIQAASKNDMELDHALKAYGAH